jgi:hypothetical protein
MMKLTLCCVELEVLNFYHAQSFEDCQLHPGNKRA